MRVGGYFSGSGILESTIADQLNGELVFTAESDTFCRKILKKRYPNVWHFDDVISVESVPVDVLTAGFPCQNLSSANVINRVGLSGQKFGLWRYILHGIFRHNPKWIVVENVTRGWRAWVPELRRELYRRGYSSVPIRMRADFFGAPHRRDRTFILAVSNSESKSVSRLHETVALVPEIARSLRQDWGVPPSEALGVADGNITKSLLRVVGNAVMPVMACAIAQVILECEN